MRLTSAFVAEQLSAAFDVYDPDLVVSVHPLMQLVPLRVLRRRAAARARAQAAAVARSGDASALGRARAAAGPPSGSRPHRRHGGEGPRFDDHHVRDPGQPPPFATVVTDLTTCHNTWFDPRVDACFVPTEECAARARRLGVPSERIAVHGLPIRPGFAKPQALKTSLRRKLGMDPEMPAVLLVGAFRFFPPFFSFAVSLDGKKTSSQLFLFPLSFPTHKKKHTTSGGGEGMGNLEATVRAIVARGEQASREATLSGNKAPSGIQVVAVCGRNAQLAKELNGADWLPRGARVLATGFVDNMEEWMGAADVIVTKAGEGVSRAWRDESRREKPPRGKKRGEENSLFSPPFSKNQKTKKTNDTGPGTIAEAIVSGLPMLLNGFIPCQEHGNVAYVTSRGIGAFERDPTKISEILEAWLTKPPAKRSLARDGGVSEELAAMRAALRPLRPRFKGALANIVDDLAELCRSGGRALVDSGQHAGHGGLREEEEGAAAAS